MVTQTACFCVCIVTRSLRNALPIPNQVFMRWLLVLSKVLERNTRWRSFYSLSLGLGFAALVGFVDMFAVMVSMTDGFKGFG